MPTMQDRPYDRFKEMHRDGEILGTIPKDLLFTAVGQAFAKRQSLRAWLRMAAKRELRRRWREATLERWKSWVLRWWGR
jgi:hypothetical protein